MDFQRASVLVNQYGLAMVQDPDGGVAAVAVGRKEGGPIAGATKFALTVFVPRKLSTTELQLFKVRPAVELFSAVAGPTVAPLEPDDLDVVESGTMFAPRQLFLTPPGLSVPAPQRGVYGGLPATLDTQKWFAALRLGISITNPVGQYPNSLSVGTLGFCMRDDAGNRYLISSNHVIGGSNAATPRDAVVQPGTARPNEH